MGFFSRLFGGPPPLTDEEFLDRVARQLPVDVAQMRKERSDDLEGFKQLLWSVVATRPAHVTPFLEALCAEELDEPERRKLLSSAAEFPEALPWLAVDVLEVSAPHEWLAPDDELRDAVAMAMQCAAEASVSQGPAGCMEDLTHWRELLDVWMSGIEASGASTHELATLPWLLQAIETHEGLTEDESLTLTTRVKQVAAAAQARAPIGAEGDASWASHLAEQLRRQGPVQAQAALATARSLHINLGHALVSRLDERGDDVAWTLGQSCLDWPDVRHAMALQAAQQLRERRTREDELCSLSSQAGCQSCGGPPGAADEDLMVPKALESRVLPVLVAIADQPKRYEDFVLECCAAPSITLRFHGLHALMGVETSAMSEESWQVLEALEGDSHPQVMELVGQHLSRRPT